MESNITFFLGNINYPDQFECKFYGIHIKFIALKVLIFTIQ